ncbi:MULTISPECIES: alpha/beta fold hydrolase [Actinomadura]|uniref:Alpha/beta fold hydrolase n=1 Tax=Actinomadura yumaensis TaxID=111807 RepID=A0ABW2CSF0_9ACTN|nr:alpha/beta fold hydrolase [Actinomadura sp. J1-007]MWK37630.1 hypothetical protein [Actinomadura sp. J1-007]
MSEVTERGARFPVRTVDPRGGTSHGPPNGPRAGARADPPVVAFVPGPLPDDLEGFHHALAGPLAEAGARAVLYEQPASGPAGPTARGPATDGAVADLFAVLDGLGHRDPVYLVATGLGGAAALNAALARPERVAGLVLIEAYGPTGHEDAPPEDTPNRPNRPAPAMDGQRPADISAFEPVRPDDLAGIRCPLLAVYGERSDIAGAGRLLLRTVPDCTLHVLPGHVRTAFRDGTAPLLEIMLPWLAHHAGTRVPAATAETAPTTAAPVAATTVPARAASVPATTAATTTAAAAASGATAAATASGAIAAAPSLGASAGASAGRAVSGGVASAGVVAPGAVVRGGLGIGGVA